MTAAPFYYTPGSFDVVDPLVIVRVVRTDANTATIVIAPGWTRIVILYNGDIIFDTDLPEDAGPPEDESGNTVIELSNLDIRLGAPPPTGPFQANAYDQVLSTQSEQTAFTIPGFGRGGGMLGGGQLVGFGGM